MENNEIKERQKNTSNISNKVKRYITGTIYFAVILALIVFENLYVSTLVIGVVSLFAVYEYYKCVGLKNSPFMFFAAGISIILTIFTLIYNQNIYSMLPNSYVYIFLINFLIALVFKTYDLKQVGLSFLGIIYSVFLLSYINRIMYLPDGRLFLILLFVVVLSTDTFAYLIGSKFGKHKLTKISPSKTIEGSVGAIIASTILVLIYTYILKAFYASGISYGFMALLGAILSIIAQLGDLVASYIKRNSGIKDFGNILVGHGGILDRIDSLIFTAPILYLLASILF